MAAHKLIRRVEPFEYEVLSSFLMRAADANGYRRFQDILTFALGSKATNPHVLVDQIDYLSDYTRTTFPEVAQLSGISRKIPRFGSAWQINGEWITKFAFVLFSRTPVCPKCLAENAYLRGDWSLVLNTSCWRHGIQLLQSCPRCRKPLTINRYLPERCLCSYDFRESLCTAASQEELLVANLVHAKTEPTMLLDSPCLPAHQIENLARLSLEGLCQSLWFLGHDLFCQFPLGTGRGHRKLSRNEVLQVIRGAFWILSDWPGRLGTTLQSIAGGTVASEDWNSAARLLGPIQRYFERQILLGDSRFIVLPYETYVRQIAARFGKTYRLPGIISPQLEFEFD